jgi:gluconolactonase
MESDQPSIQAVMNKLKSTDFIAWDPLFFEVIGQKAALERIQSFEGQHPTVHEAPAYVPETNELIYADTSVTGWLWAIDLDTLKVGLPISPTI